MLQQVNLTTDAKHFWVIRLFRLRSRVSARKPLHDRTIEMFTNDDCPCRTVRVGCVESTLPADNIFLLITVFWYVMYQTHPYVMVCYVTHPFAELWAIGQRPGGDYANTITHNASLSIIISPEHCSIMSVCGEKVRIYNPKDTFCPFHLSEGSRLLLNLVSKNRDGTPKII